MKNKKEPTNFVEENKRFFNLIYKYIYINYKYYHKKFKKIDNKKENYLRNKRKE